MGKKKRRREGNPPAPAVPEEKPAAPAEKTDYFATYYRDYKNDYVTQYLNAYRRFKNVDRAPDAVDNGEDDPAKR